MAGVVADESAGAGGAFDDLGGAVTGDRFEGVDGAVEAHEDRFVGPRPSAWRTAETVCAARNLNPVLCRATASAEADGRAVRRR
jgi:hypothetical protein